MTNGKTFATSGTESFKISSEGQKEDKVVLNIQEEKHEAVVLDKKQNRRDIYTGNVLIDTYRKINNYFVEHSSVKPQKKAQFFHLLSVMVNSGIPMIKSLNSLALQTEDSLKLKYVITDLVSAVENGQSLSSALKDHPDVFTEQEIGMVQAGEASGQLSRVLDNLSKDSEKAYQIKSKIKSAMMYPIVILFLLVAVVAVLMIYVIPQLKSLFASMGADLPFLTRVVLAISNFFVEYKVILAVGILLLILGIMIFKKTSIGRYSLDKLKINLPLFGKLFKKAYLSRFSRSLSNLLDSSVTILKTLEISANSIGNEVYRRRILLSLEDIKQGIPLAENLTDSNLFPPMMVNMIEVGEKTAQMSEITEKIAIFYENEVDTSISGISKIIEPVFLIIMGLTVAAVVAAIMLPIMSMSKFTGAM